jgi:hypothetical protein
MDNISRYCLLAYLRANPNMTYEKIVQFIESMQPMEIDGAHSRTFTNCKVAFWPYEQKEFLLEALPSLNPGDHLEFTQCELTVWPPDSMG